MPAILDTSTTLPLTLQIGMEALNQGLDQLTPQKMIAKAKKAIQDHPGNAFEISLSAMYHLAQQAAPEHARLLDEFMLHMDEVLQ